MRLGLLARIHRRGFQTVTETHRVGPLLLNFTRIADPDTVLERIVHAEDLRHRLTGQHSPDDQLHLPYWAELWDSALGLAEHLTTWNDLRLVSSDSPSQRPARRSRTNHRKMVLDLGCGMGFAGMVAAAMGARVLLADLEPDALLFARLNTLPWHPHARTRRLDWRTDRLDQRFDLILGADVLYDRAQWPHLQQFFRHHLRPHGVVLLGEPGRQTGDLFLDWITARGWDLQYLQQPLPGRQRKIRLYRIRPLTAEFRD
ncbi:class I SAM-dependent methyltransferase [Fontivita pretiosa]|uniref:class I SAM-dependent methyltransferase n=1 Tax=Fontivita pretiosa TaxID=2989684 RepID=UPI003D171E6C